MKKQSASIQKQEVPISSANFGVGWGLPAVHFAQEVPPVLGAARPNIGHPRKSHAATAGPQPTQSAGRTSHPLPNVKAQRGVGIGRSGIFKRKKSGGLERLQPMVDRRQVRVLCTHKEVATIHVSMRNPSCMCVECSLLRVQQPMIVT